jgi:hypothetical protein
MQCYNEELHNLLYSQNFIKMIRSRIIGVYDIYVARMTEAVNVYIIILLVGFRVPALHIRLLFVIFSPHFLFELYST